MDGISLKVNFDPSGLKRLPQEAREALSRFQLVFNDLNSPAQARLNKAISPFFSGKGPSASELAEMRRNFRASNRVLQEYYDEQARIIKENAKKFAVEAERRADLARRGHRIGDPKDLEKELKAIRDMERRSMDALKGERRRTMRDMSALSEEATAGGAGGRGGATGWFREMFGGGPSGAVGGILRSIGIPLGVSGLTYFAIDQTRRALSRDTERFNLAKRIGSFGDLTTGREDFARSLGIPLLGPDAAIQAYSQFTGLAGANRRSMAPGAALLGIGMGVGAEGGTQFFGQMARIGAVRNDGEQKRFALLIGEAVVNAQMRGREGEMLQSITEFMSMGMRTMVNAPSGTDAVTMMMKLAATGGEGTRGELGMRILGAAHGALSGTDLFPGVGGVLQPFMLQALVSGGITDPAEMQKIAQQGMFGKVGGKFLYESVLDQMEGSGLFATGMGRLMGSRSFGMSVEQFDKFRQMRTAGDFTMIPEELRDKVMSSPQRIGMSMAALEDYKAGKLSREGLAAAIQKVVTETPGPEERQQAAADAANALDEAFRKLVPIIDTVAEAFNNLLGKVGITSVVNTAAGGVAAGASVFGIKSGLKLAGGLAAKTASAVGATGVAGAIGTATRVATSGPVTASLMVGGSEDQTRQAWERQKAEAVMAKAGPLSRVPADVREAIFRAAQQEGVDPAYLASIWLAEGGEKSFNPFGIKVVSGQNVAKGSITAERGALIAAQTVAKKKREFEARGGRALDATGKYTSEFNSFFGSVWAPAGAANDPTGLNKNWTGNVAGNYGVRVAFEPLNVVLKNEKGEVVGTAQAVPRASTTSGVAE